MVRDAVYRENAGRPMGTFLLPQLRGKDGSGMDAGEEVKNETAD